MSYDILLWYCVIIMIINCRQTGSQRLAVRISPYYVVIIVFPSTRRRHCTRPINPFVDRDNRDTPFRRVYFLFLDSFSWIFFFLLWCFVTYQWNAETLVETYYLSTRYASGIELPCVGALEYMQLFIFTIITGTGIFVS